MLPLRLVVTGVAIGLGMDADAFRHACGRRASDGPASAVEAAAYDATIKDGLARRALGSLHATGPAGPQIHYAASGDHRVPVDGGPARDLRAAAVAVNLDAAAHRSFATAHWPDARAQAAEGDFVVLFSGRDREKISGKEPAIGR